MSGNISEKEHFLLDMIRKNPYVSQQEVAEALGLSRPSIANLISGLTKKGYIVGRAYILKESQPIICIGGANIDRKFYLKDKAQLGTSNPVKSNQSPGGVARNIAENLGRLGMESVLLTACGGDSDWKFIEDSSSLYMDLNSVAQISGMATGSYSAVLDSSGDLIIALADMDVYDSISTEVVQQQERLLSNAKCIVADLNCPKETLQFIAQFANAHDVPLAFIPVSSPKMNRLPDELSGVTWLITNRDESETFFNCKVESKEEWIQIVEKWLALGISNVVVTNGKEGAMFGNKEEGIFHQPAIETEQVVDVTGAGDAFSSAVIFSWLEGKPLQSIAKAGTVNASKTLQSSYTVRQDLSATQLIKDMEEL
ncbi:Sugar or nucleoside kinase, ribokinase family [Mesobacillus persicus]|uniref:Sugar or nucleoside kinase, ribokinase family n=2 Tax=Mesobacillus persicus TaxID=930146 RepID=A0A1H8JB85_9BACI|nr:Sugar or nucleoside kinase, ribokinase family [Mesobacillus persicus]